MKIVLVRFGIVPEVARARVTSELFPTRGDDVVVKTHRGEELATILEVVKPSPEPNRETPEPTFEVLRTATAADQLSRSETLRELELEFPTWGERIQEWGLDLQLVELERTLDGEKLILYVLNDRGPECTKLALQAAAAGLGLIEVQPVGADGPVALPAPAGGGGCGSCGCH